MGTPQAISCPRVVTAREILRVNCEANEQIPTPDHALREDDERVLDV